MIPGRKNVAGDTLCVDRIPLHPVVITRRAKEQAIHANFAFNLTESSL
jgi:hypothetical protein